MRINNLNHNIDLLNLLRPEKNSNDLFDLLKMQHTIPRYPKSGMDSYIPSKDSMYVSYGNKPEHIGKYSNAVLDRINFKRDVMTDETNIIINGVNYPKKDIPFVDCDRCLEIKAENNEIVFERGKYYKYKDRDGNDRALACVYDSLSQPYSEQLAEKQYRQSAEMGSFWGILGCEGFYGRAYYSHDEQRKILNDAGITEGFFSVQVGSKKQELFYSNGVAGVVLPKWRYDATYNMFMNQNVLKDYETGSVFTIGGKEYVLSADKKLDIPYGADIYDIKYPPADKKIVKD